MNKMSEKEFANKYCGKCGTQRCEGVGTEFADGCNYYLKYVLGLEFYTEEDDKETCVKIEHIAKDINASHEENINRLKEMIKGGLPKEEILDLLYTEDEYREAGESLVSENTDLEEYINWKYRGKKDTIYSDDPYIRNKHMLEKELEHMNSLPPEQAQEEARRRLQRIGLLDKSGRSREEAVKTAKEQMEKEKAEMESYELLYKDMPISKEEVYADLEESRKNVANK